jgi:hypothetical protein
VHGLWHGLRKDLNWLPALSYRRSLSLVVLWGLLFVIVLTMISGARELMTPGAWRKQGWTYKLNDTAEPRNSQATRRAALERLRVALWQYAATHQGLFPSDDDPAIAAELWQIPDSNLKFALVPNQQAEQAGRLLVYEPELEAGDRQVLLTNGMIGTMRSDEIVQATTEAAQSGRTRLESDHGRPSPSAAGTIGSNHSADPSAP